MHPNRHTIADELSAFMDEKVGFAADATMNDMWLELDFDDLQFEQDLAEFIQALFGKRYTPLADAHWKNKL